jgi:hypothetical protein
MRRTDGSFLLPSVVLGCGTTSWRKLVERTRADSHLIILLA